MGPDSLITISLYLGFALIQSSKLISYSMRKSAMHFKALEGIGRRVWKELGSYSKALFLELVELMFQNATSTVLTNIKLLFSALRFQRFGNHTAREPITARMIQVLRTISSRFENKFNSRSKTWVSIFSSSSLEQAVMQDIL